MDNWQLMRARHSVRNYRDEKIAGETLAALQAEIAACNAESGLHIQLVLDEPAAFDFILARIGSFKNARNYLALVGPATAEMAENCGYYGERLVLKALELGLGSCWVAGTFSKRKCKAQVGAGEKLFCVISLGYADDMGSPRKTKSVEELSQVTGEMPLWFRRGMEAVQLAPTAVNRQKFLFILDGGQVLAQAGDKLPLRLDLGIAKYHFELGAAGAEWQWGGK